MEWKITKMGDEVTWRAVVPSGLTEQELCSALVSMWRLFWEKIAVLNPESEWDAINCEYWMDSGRLITFVKKRSRNERIDKGTCELVVMDFLTIWESLAAKYPDNGKRFDTDIRKEQVRFSQLIKKAANHESVIANFSVQNLVVEFWDADACCVEEWRPNPPLLRR